MKINEITDLLEIWYPLELAEEWDTTGLQSKPRNDEITGIVVALTLTEDVIEFAVNENCNMIICHHPLFFNDENNMDLLNKKSINLCKSLTKNGVGFYALHTNFDKKYMSMPIADLLELRETRHLDGETCLGVVGKLDNSLSYIDVLEKIKDVLNLECIRYSDVDLDKKIEKVALCPGSGREFLDDAIKNADIYLTGDLNYHAFEKAVYYDFPLIDICHHNSEIIGVRLLAEKLESETDVKVLFYEGKDFYNNFN